MTPIHFLLGGAAWLALAHAALADGHTLKNAKLSLVFGSSANGYTTNDADRVDAVSWVNSAGATVTNYVTSGGAQHCGDPQEFWGESYGDTGDLGVPLPNIVIAGVTSVWSGKGNVKGKAVIASLVSCDTTLDATTTTSYAVSRKPGLIDTLKISRAFTFAPSPHSGNIRAYVPRLQLAVYGTVLAPNAAGVVQSYQASACPLNCSVTDWNGKWFADDDGAGNGMAVFRNPAANPRAMLTVDWDGSSSSNNSAVTLIMPAKGWHGSKTETEYLCFYDAASWPAADRANGTPPAGCSGVPH